MTVVEDHNMNDPRDQFPAGMRVLAVDDDPTCLFVLETMLRRCQYHVTATKNAITALKLLRENKSKFDLVISDVHMPEMDGFKLLELVGLEMDLPVIMLSVNDDRKMVMKGITHGACDYLLKPVRIEELQNIWQHVIRRKKMDSKGQGKSNNQDKFNSNSCNGLGSAETGNSDQDGKPSKKRKDHDEDDDDDEHENGDDDDEDPSTQKKPRVVWSVELHRKFVAAVNQLGIDKAVPKKILDLMNVEKLSRENVASHLQKYRLYLKRISCVANQQANMVAALGSANPSYMRMGSSVVGHLQTLTNSRQFHNNAFGSFLPCGMINRRDTPSGLNVFGFPSTGTRSLGHAQKLNNSTNDQLKFQSAIVCGNQNGLQGMPISLGLDQLQNNKGVSPIQDLTTLIDHRSKVTMGCALSPILGISNNTLKLEANSQDIKGGRAYENSTSLASQHSQFSHSMLCHGRCSDMWSTGVQSYSYPPSEHMPPIDNMTHEPLQGGNLSGCSSITSPSKQSYDSLSDMHSQEIILKSTPSQINSNVPFQVWDQDSNYHSQVIGDTIDSLIPVNGVVDPNDCSPINTTFNRNLNFKFCNPLQMKHDGIMELTELTSLKPHQEGYIMNQRKSQNSCISNNLGSLEDLVTTMTKQKQDKVKLVDGYVCSNNNSGGTYM